MGGSSKQTIGQRYFAKLTTFIGNPIEKFIGINFDNRGWIFKPDNMETFLRVESPNLYGDKEGGVAGFIDIHTGTADQLPNATYSADFPKVSGYPFQSYLLFRGLGKKPATSGGVSQFAQSSPKHYNNSFYHGNSGYMKEMLLWPQRIHVRNDGRPQWYDEKAGIGESIFYKYVENSIVTNETPYTVNEYFEMDGVNFRDTTRTSIVNNSLEKGFAQASWGQTSTGNLSYAHKITCSASLTMPNIDGVCDVFGHVDFFAQTARIDVQGIFNIKWLDDIHYGRNYFEAKAPIAGTKKVTVIALDPAQSPVTGQIFGASVSLALKNPHSGYLQSLNITDINPIHKIREILTDDTAMNKLETDVNDQNFMKAADKIWNEGLGISWAVTEKSCLEAINELCGHIESGVRINRQTGLYEMVLFRDDWFEENEIHTLPTSKIKNMNLDGLVAADELINRLNVSYYNQDAIKNSSFSIADNACIRNLNGRENSEEVKFPYFMKQYNSTVVAQWKLKQMSTPVWQGTFTTGFYNARKWNRYDLLKLAWPRRWNGTILVRIIKINLGTGTEVSIDFVEVVPYSSNLSPNIVIDTPIDTMPKPPSPALFKAFELSYLEAVQLNGQKAVDEVLAYNPDAGYAAVIAKRPQDNSLNALMYTDIGNDYERAGAIVYSETAELDQSLSKMDTVFVVKNAGDLDMVSTGTQITVNNEIMVYQSYNSQTRLLTVKRGALDKIPQNHLAGSVLYFADDFVTVDPTEYVFGEIINVKALTTTPSGILSTNDVDAQQVEIKARAIRPYPPANVKINDAYFPETTVISNDIVLTWVHRNRLQQTGGEILGFYEGGITLETGVTYSIEIHADETVLHQAVDINANTYVIPAAVLIQNKPHRLRIWSVRDGYASYNFFEHSFFVESASLILTATTDGNRVTGNTVPLANVTVDVDESLSAKLMFDGAGISGKAEPGATITVDIEE